MEIEIRELRDEDLDRVCELESLSFSMPWKKEDFKELIESNNSVYLVILADGLVVGTAGYTDNGFEGYINNVVIDEHYRRHNLGSRLMEALIKYGNEHGVKDFTLEVRVSNASAIALYEKFGFESAGVRKRFYEKPIEDAYVYWLRG